MKRAVLIFAGAMVLISLPLLLFPINLFSGEIVLQNGITELKEQAPLSLSYFIGMGLNEGDLDQVKDFYLLPKGWITALLFIVCIPALIAYRYYLKAK